MSFFLNWIKKKISHINWDIIIFNLCTNSHMILAKDIQGWSFDQGGSGGGAKYFNNGCQIKIYMLQPRVEHMILNNFCISLTITLNI